MNITAKLRRLEKANNADKVRTFLSQAVWNNWDLRPWEKRVNALIRQVGLVSSLASPLPSGDNNKEKILDSRNQIV